MHQQHHMLIVFVASVCSPRNNSAILHEYLATSATREGKCGDSPRPTAASGGGGCTSAPSGASSGASGFAEAQIKRLVSTVALLRQERDALAAELEDAKSGGGGKSGGLARLTRENARLRTENANLFLMTEENKRLRAKCEDLEARVACLKKKRARNPEARKEDKATDAKGNTQKQKQQSSAKRGAADFDTLLEDVGELDPEIASLIRRNARGLKKIRRDIRKTKRDVKAWEAEGNARSRPSTAAPGGSDARRRAQVFADEMRQKHREHEQLGAQSAPKDALLARASAAASDPRPHTAALGTGMNAHAHSLLQRPIRSFEDVHEALASINIAHEQMAQLARQREQLDKQKKCCERNGRKQGGEEVLANGPKASTQTRGGTAMNFPALFPNNSGKRM